MFSPNGAKTLKSFARWKWKAGKWESGWDGVDSREKFCGQLLGDGYIPEYIQIPSFFLGTTFAAFPPFPFACQSVKVNANCQTLSISFD